MAKSPKSSYSTARMSSPDLKELHFFLDVNDNGLGCRFMDKLNQHKDKIQQVNAVTGVTETNGSLRNRAIQVACEMQTRGIKPDDVVVICSASHTDQTVAILASLFVGAILAPVDLEISIGDLKERVTTLKPKMIFCDARVCGILEIIYKSTPELVACPIIVFGDHADRFAFEKLLVKKLNLDFKPTRIEDTKRGVAFIIPSQGTESSSKLICISHRAILLQISVFAESFLKGVQRALSYFPLCWITQILIICYCLESQVVRIYPGEFSERGACRIINDLNIDCAFFGTDYATKISKHQCLQDFDTSSLKLIFVGGYMTTASQMATLRKTFKTKVIQCYGTTEMTGLIATFGPEDYENALKRPGSVGLVLPYIKSKILDIETREVLGANTWGELLLHGPTNMLGYFKDTVGSEMAYEKKYLKTGDIALFDSDGYFHIRGRISDHVKINGKLFCPTEIEEMIKTHPEIEEVVLVCNEDNNDLVACIVRRKTSKLTADEVLAFINQEVPENKRPTKIKFLEFMPKSNVGKIQRSAIKQALGVTIVYSKSIVSFEA